MKRILLTTICFLGISGVVMAQEKKTEAATTKRIPKSEHKAREAKLVAEKQAANKQSTSTTIQKATQTTN